MLRIKKIADMLEKQVYTDNGEFFGKVEEINIVNNRIDGWRIVAKDLTMLNLLGGSRGIIVPHQFIKAIGDIVIISRNAVPAVKEEESIVASNEDEM
jgi:sporulation protein YlmC with PRC-barrel domain